MGAAPCKLLLCGGGGGGVVRMAMKAAPNDGELQGVSEKLLALLESARDLELGEYLMHASQISIINAMDSVEELSDDVQAALAAAGAPAAKFRKKVCAVFQAADDAIRPILISLTVGWDAPQ